MISAEHMQELVDILAKDEYKIRDVIDMAYEKGRADQKEEDNEFFNFEGAWELEKRKIRTEVIDECIEALGNNIWDIAKLEQLKGAENE